MYIGQTLHEAAVLNKIDIGWGAPGAPPEVKRSERWIEPYVQSKMASCMISTWEKYLSPCLIHFQKMPPAVRLGKAHRRDLITWCWLAKVRKPPIASLPSSKK